MRGNFNKKIAPYIVVVGITCIISFIYFTLYKNGDTQFLSMDMDKAMDSFIVRLIAENRGETQNFLSFCEYNIQNIVILLLCNIFGNVYIGLNFYYMLSFLFIAIAAYWYFEKLGITTDVSIYLSILMSFLPYHINRGQGQIITSSFFMAPIFAGLLFEIFYEAKAEKINKIYFIVMCIAPLIDLRLSVMVLILMIILVMHRHMLNVTKISAIYVCPLIVISFLLHLLTEGFRESDLGESIELAREEGMRILDLVMPFRYHISGRLSDLRLDYDVSFSAYRESGLNSMGLLLSIGFVGGMWLLFFSKKSDQRIAWLSWVSILVILIANVSGFNILFEYFGIHITYWNRMAIFILLSSGAALGMFVDKIRSYSNKKSYSVIMGIMLLVIGIAEFAELLLRQNTPIF